MSRKRRRNGYITIEVEKDVDIDDILDEIDDDDLLDEVKNRGLKTEREQPTVVDVDYSILCDMFGVSYYTPISEILVMLEVKLNNEKVS